MPRSALTLFLGLSAATACAAVPALSASALTTSTATAPALDAAQQLYERVTPSLVAVQYTLDTELGRRDLIFPGVVVGADGLVMIPLAAVSEQFPDSQLKDFKIIVPKHDADAQELDAIFQGRDERSSIAFVKTKEPQKWTPIAFKSATPKIGDTIFSVGLLPKTGGYRSYLMRAMVSSRLRGDTLQILVGDGGLATAGSPVFNAQGQAIGFVNYQPPYPLLLNDKNPLGALINPPKFITPTSEFAQSLADPPTADHPIPVPFSGVSELSGLKKEMAEYFGLDNQPAVQIGAVVPGTPAEKAGLQAEDIIVKFNGQPLERGDDPDDLPLILRHQLLRLKPGDVVTFSVLSPKTGKDQPPKDVKVTLEAQPPRANVAERFWTDDLGFGVREMVFLDSFALHLKPDTHGVIVTIVKPESSAASGHLHMGDLVIDLDGQPVTGLDEFKTAYAQFRKAQPHDPVVMVVRREGHEETIRIEPPQ
jgi:serine protease Do